MSKTKTSKTDTPKETTTAVRKPEELIALYSEMRQQALNERQKLTSELETNTLNIHRLEGAIQGLKDLMTDIQGEGS